MSSEVLAAQQSPENPNWFQGTADVVRQYLRLFEEHNVLEYLILVGDHLYRMDYDRFIQAHRETDADITVAALPMDEKRAIAFGLMKIDEEGWITEFCGKLTALDIGNNAISSKGAHHVAEFIMGNKILSWISIYMNDIGDEGAASIADALKENRTITSIDLGGNDIHAKGIETISRVRKDNTVINSMKYMAYMLKYNNTIATLDLRANGLRDDGAAICLARSLKVVNEALVSLDLGFNEIRDEVAFSISQALKANEDARLTSLNLSGNFLTKLGQSAIADARDHVVEHETSSLDSDICR